MIRPVLRRLLWTLLLVLVLGVVTLATFYLAGQAASGMLAPDLPHPARHGG